MAKQVRKTANRLDEKESIYVMLSDMMHHALVGAFPGISLGFWIQHPCPCASTFMKSMKIVLFMRMGMHVHITVERK